MGTWVLCKKMKIQSRKSRSKEGVTRITTIVTERDWGDGLVGVSGYALDTDFQSDGLFDEFSFHEIAAAHHARQVHPRMGGIPYVKTIENGYVFEYEEGEENE